MEAITGPKIIFEDDAILVLDKPAGWIVNEADTTTDQPVIQSWLKKTYSGNKAYPIVNTTPLRSGVVHRLDKETSGILLVAKTEEAFESLQIQFKERKVEKTYIALVHGKVEPEKGTIEATVGRLPWRRDRFGILPGGRESRTDYETISNYQLAISNEKLTLLKLYPKTGRTHQIRIHLKYIGHPIVSDEFYAGRKTARNDRKWCPRLFLHASGIKFFHPQTGRLVKFKLVLPSDLAEVLEHLSATS
jgi:23S rRNA pseudouridine1911/1915/1917 synthase